MSQVPTIKANAQKVIDMLGTDSGIPHFGYNADSVAYLDGFIDRQGESFRANPQAASRLVSMLGSFVGEATIATYGGQWQDSGDRVCIALTNDKGTHFIFPFDKVAKRLSNGPEDSLAYFFAAIPQAISDMPPSGPPPLPTGQPPPLPSQDKKPWWKPF